MIGFKVDLGSRSGRDAYVWCQDNLKDGTWYIITTFKTEFVFHKEEDAVLFALKFL